MSRTYRYLSWIVVAAFALAVAAGCGGAPTPAAQPTKAPEAKPVTLSIWTGFPELEPFYKAVGADYTKSHPNVSFEVLSASLREMEQKLSAAVPTGSGPDIYDIGPNIIVKFVEGKLVDPNPPEVEQLVKSGAYNKATVDYLTYSGKTYGVPLFDGSLASLYYNKTMFKEAGLDPNKPPATMDEMMEYAKKLVKYDASGNIVRSGMSLRLSGQGSGITEKFWFILHNMGGEPVVPTKDGTKYHNGYNNDAGRKALKYYIDAVYKYHVDDQKVPHDGDAFAAGNTAMLLRESWVIGTISSTNPKLDYGVAPMPKNVKWDTLFQPWGVYVNKTSQNQAVAWDLVKFMTNKENSLRITKVTGWISPRKDVDWSVLTKEIPQYGTFVNPPKELGFYAYPLFGSFDEILSKMADRLTKAYLDKSLLDNPDGIAKTIKDMADETDSILKANGLYGTD